MTGDLAPELSKDGQRRAAVLAKQEVDSEPIKWTDTAVEWGSYDGVLVRSCWD